jgi:hypothetical protein
MKFLVKINNYAKSLSISQSKDLLKEYPCQLILIVKLSYGTSSNSIVASSQN